ncbi:MAG TPA: aminomethyltransferase family protein [Pyrinomonadaceae bacterium]|nr:aminomethyltransferase family protein [Pyrinomonadaceae bacterium]
MTETLKILNSPLEETQRQLGATFAERDGWHVPISFGDVRLEYASVRKSGAGLIDLSSRARIAVSGTEAVQFLNGLITNDMKTLAENTWMAAAFPNVQGRLLASVRVARLQENNFLIDTEPATHEQVLKTIERFTMAGDFRVTDITSRTAMLSLQGTDAAVIAGKALQQDLSGVEPKAVARVSWPEGVDQAADFSTGLTLLRATYTAADGFEFIVEADHAVALWNTLLDAGATPVGYETLETLRIEAGLPRYGVDMDDSNVVTEALFDDAVSYTKGCYLGQEIIARIKYRGHVAKQLSGIAFGEAVDLRSGALVKSEDDKDAGRLTSVTFSPQLERTIALGYLKYDYLAPGTKVKVAVENGEAIGGVTKLPFIQTASDERSAAD